MYISLTSGFEKYDDVIFLPTLSPYMAIYILTTDSYGFLYWLRYYIKNECFAAN